MRGTKILATVGPASDSEAELRALLKAGANGFRFNFSHGTDEEHRTVLRRVHRVVDGRDPPVALVADLQGPKIRLGDLNEPNYRLREGDELVLDTSGRPGDGRRVSVTLPELVRSVRPGDPLLLGDGSTTLVVVKVEGDRVLTRVDHPGVLSAHAGLFLPRAKLRTEILGEKDRSDLRIALKEGVDFVAVSFVRDASDLVLVRRTIERVNPSADVGLIAKVERAEALRHIDAILQQADGIMVARGDLGIEVPLERLALVQKMLIRRANIAGRTVIVATQMLLSMVNSPRPTRAEATDVANAVLDGADAVMLSEESAVGQYPSEAVAWLDRIARATEPAIDRERFAQAPRPLRAEAVVAESAVRLAALTRAVAIVTPTHSGRTARLVARHRPRAPVWAFSSSPAVRHRLALAWGVRPFAAPLHQTLVEMRSRAVAVARHEGVPRGGQLVLTAGYPVEGRPTNLVTLVEVDPPRVLERPPRPPAPGARPA
jgi:pyruvate kinase